MKITHSNTDIALGSNIKLANTFWSRLKGLMFQDSFGEHDGIYFTWSKSVHNCFVKFPIDVIFISKDYKIVKIIRSFKPWRFTRIYLTASHVIELPENTVTDSFNVGDQLEVVD